MARQRAYAFKDPKDVQNLKKISQRYSDFNERELPAEDVGFYATPNVILTSYEVESSGDPSDSSDSFTLQEGAGVRLRKLDNELEPHVWGTDQESTQTFSNLEPTNHPANVKMLTLKDTYNRRYGFQITPSEVFGELDARWDGVDHDTAVEVTLDEGFTVHGQNSLEAYPAPMLQEALQETTKVTCRYVKAAGRWFFFRPSTSGSMQISVYGDPLDIQHSATGKTVFYTEIAAGESVASMADPLLLIAAPVSVPVQGAASGAWVTFWTYLDTPDESPAYWNASGPLYQYRSGGKYRIAPVEFYGKVISDGTGTYFLPSYRTINGERYWKQSGGNSYIYRTKKEEDWGFALGIYLGKYLTENDLEPFVSDADAQTGGFEDALAALMDQQGLTYGKPEWVSDDMYGLYSPNSEMESYDPSAEDVQFGCEYWEAPSWTDEDEEEHEFAFTHVCDGSVKKWMGEYECQAFHVVFKNIRETQEPGVSSFVGYILGDPNSTKGYYVGSVPDTSQDWDFEYRPGDHGLRCELTFESVDENHVETWTMKYGGEVTATYTRQEGGTSLTYQTPGQDEQDDAHKNYAFRNISRSASDDTYIWTAAGVDGTVGTLEFEGEELSMTGKNIFVFHHQIALTFEGYERAIEHTTVYMVSPGIIS